MAANTLPIFVGTLACAPVSFSTANTNRDGTGTIGTLITAGSNGSRIDAIRIQAAGTTTAGVVRIFHHDGTTNRLIREILVAAVTPSTTQEAWSAEWVPTVPLTIPSGHSIGISTHNAESFNAIAIGGSY